MHSCRHVADDNWDMTSSSDQLQRFLLLRVNIQKAQSPKDICGYVATAQRNDILLVGKVAMLLLQLPWLYMPANHSLIDAIAAQLLSILSSPSFHKKKEETLQL